MTDTPNRTAGVGIYDMYRLHGLAQCQWCGIWHGPRCPQVQAVEYHPDGTVRRVEFIKPEPIDSTSRAVEAGKRSAS